MASTSAHGPRRSPPKKVEWYHGKNNAVAWQEHQPAHEQGMKGNMSWIKEEETYTQEMSGPRKE